MLLIENLIRTTKRNMSCCYVFEVYYFLDTCVLNYKLENRNIKSYIEFFGISKCFTKYQELKPLM